LDNAWAEALLQTDERGHLLSIDQEWSRTIGVTLGRPWMEAIAQEQRPDVEAGWARAVAARAVFHVTVSCVLPEGVRAATIHAEPATTSVDEPAPGGERRYLGALEVHDAAGLDGAKVLEAVADAILVVRADGRIELANGPADRMFGCGPGELVGCSVDDLLPGSMRAAHRGHREAFAAAPRVRPMGDRVLVARRKDGTLLPVEIRLSPLLSTGELLVSAVVRDVGDRALRENEALLRGRMTGVEVFSSTLLHEINNPLTTIVANLDIAAAELRAGTADWTSIGELVGDATMAALQIRDLVRDLHSLANPEYGERAPLDVHAVIDKAVRLAGPLVSTTLRIERRYEARSLAVANSVLLGQVFLNLLANASEAMSEQPTERRRIELRTYDAGAHVVCEIVDGGPGVPPALADRIFDPHFSTKGRDRQSGIGLAVSRHIVEGFGGHLNLVDTEGPGATFRVELLQSQ
jgi:PAS domain S-box-containing protein